MASLGSSNARRIERRVPPTGGKDVLHGKPVKPPEDDDRHVYSFQEVLEWDKTIQFIRFKLKKRRDDTLLDIICRYDETSDIVLHFKMRDVYLVGFSLGDAVYRFNEPGLLPGSISLGYGSGYRAMGFGDTMAGINIGYLSFERALREMIRGRGLQGRPRQKWMGDIRRLIPRVLVMLPECVRFKWHHLYVSRRMTNDNQLAVNFTVTDWMELGIKNWSNTSGVASKITEPPSPFQLPGDNHDYTVNDINNALEYWDWAKDLLVVHCLPKCLPHEKRIMRACSS